MAEYDNTLYIVTWISLTLDGVWIDNQIYWILQNVTTNNLDSPTELYTPKITVTTAHTKSSWSSPAVAG
jgi:hypothetical protein